MVPQFGGNEQLLALYNGGDHPLQRGTDFLLVLIDQSAIDVPVAVADGSLDLPRTLTLGIGMSSSYKASTYRVLNLTGLREPCSQTNLRELLAGGERNDGRGHLGSAGVTSADLVV